MNNLKQQLILHLALQVFGIFLWFVGFAEAVMLAYCGLWTYWVYAYVALAFADYFVARMKDHCHDYRCKLRTLQEIELCKNIPLQLPCPPRHRNIRYVQRYEQKGKYAK